VEQVLIYLVVGAVAGVIAGLFGVGGGLVIVPVLTFIFIQNGFDYSIIVHLAIGTSLATIIFTSLSSIRAHHLHGAIQWQIVKQLVPGIIFGALLGAIVANFLATTLLKMFFAVFELLVALQILLSISPDAHQRLPSTKILSGVGIVIGSVSSLVGIGGGTLTVPFLVWCRVPMRFAIATSSACGLPIAITGSLGFLVVGLNNINLPEYTIGYIHWPSLIGIVSASMVFAPLGAKLTHLLPTEILRKSFSFLLIFLAVKMLMQ